MKKTTLFIIAVSIASYGYSQVTIQKNAGVYLQPNSVMTVQGNLESDDDISGDGSIQFKGTGMQTINTHGRALGGLTVDNLQNVSLAGPLLLSHVLLLQTGRLQCGSEDLLLGNDAVTEGGSAASFIQTNGSGRVKKSINRDLANYNLPVGNRDVYAPIVINSKGAYNNAVIGISANSKASINKPAASDAYLNNSWSVQRSGITGTLLIDAKYASVNGREQNLQGAYWNGVSWSAENSKLNLNNRTILMSIPDGKGEIYAMHSGREDLEVFPNPVISVATIHVNSLEEGDAVLQVFDGTGHPVMSKKITLAKGFNQYQLNVGAITKGHYTIKLISRNKGTTTALIKA